MPLPVGSISPMAALAAMAASTALPPRSRSSTPARAARGWLAATIPHWVVTTERPALGGGAVAALAAVTADTDRATLRKIAARFKSGLPTVWRLPASEPTSCSALGGAVDDVACLAPPRPDCVRGDVRSGLAPAEGTPRESVMAGGSGTARVLHTVPATEKETSGGERACPRRVGRLPSMRTSPLERRRSTGCWLVGGRE